MSGISCGDIYIHRSFYPRVPVATTLSASGRQPEHLKRPVLEKVFVTASIDILFILEGLRGLLIALLSPRPQQKSRLGLALHLPSTSLGNLPFESEMAHAYDPICNLLRSKPILVKESVIGMSLVKDLRLT